MKNYKVTWEIELSANNPLEAAEEAAHSIQFGTAKCFETIDVKTGEKHLVDLDEKNEDERVTVRY